ncbi:PmoA family protein [Saccharothrix sp. NEAU-S10]|nr:PmoA family protein [Saccharothrix luteola]
MAPPASTAASTSSSTTTGPRRTAGSPPWTGPAGPRRSRTNSTGPPGPARAFFTERRTLGAHPIGSRTWVLTLETEMTNVSGADVAIGSPTTKGRENAGYCGLLWRGPQSFTGRHDGSTDRSLVLVVDDRDNPDHPPRWFARTEEFACLNPAPFFSRELTAENSATTRFRYGVIEDHPEAVP